MIYRKELIEIGKEWDIGQRAQTHEMLLVHSFNLIQSNQKLKREVEILCQRDNPKGWRAKSPVKRYAHTQAIFNRLRRLELANDDLLVDCFTCNKFDLPWNAVDCGHFRKATKRMTRFDRRNTRIQCVECNQWKGGNESEYRAALDREQEGLAGELTELSNIKLEHDIEELAGFLMLFKVELATEGYRRGIEPKLTQF